MFNSNETYTVLFSVILILWVVNAFNLIDGINGLAGTIGFLANVVLGWLLFSINDVGYAFVGFAAAGAIAGFLRFNFIPKIFMGDSGAMVIGLISVVLSIRYINVSKLDHPLTLWFHHAPAISVALFIVPVFDVLRIFTIRILHLQPPFIGDRNHVHHRMKDLGFNDFQVVLILTAYTVAMLILSFLFDDLENLEIITLLFLISVCFNTLLTFLGAGLKLKTIGL